jgi:hypothetical protein
MAVIGGFAWICWRRRSHGKGVGFVARRGGFVALEICFVSRETFEKGGVFALCAWRLGEGILCFT